MTTRYAAIVEYDGSNYCGWQRQNNHVKSVQSQIENALSKVAAHRVEIYCAGRTDAGVHALAQVFHFDSNSSRSEFAWLAGGNSYLPHDIRLQCVRAIANDFHARYSALARRYVYLIYNADQPSSLWRQRCYWQQQTLDVALMHDAAQLLCGEHDFSAFRGADCQAKTPQRKIINIEIAKKNNWITIEICANAFLHHMVRNIVGTLLPIGKGNRDKQWLNQVLESGDRRLAAATAPPQALYLQRVFYPQDINLPNFKKTTAWMI